MYERLGEKKDETPIHNNAKPSKYTIIIGGKTTAPKK